MIIVARSHTGGSVPLRHPVKDSRSTDLKTLSTKKPLRQRIHQCACGIGPVDRDVYSAFLAYHFHLVSQTLDRGAARAAFAALQCGAVDIQAPSSCKRASLSGNAISSGERGSERLRRRAGSAPSSGAGRSGCRREAGEHPAELPVPSDDPRLCAHRRWHPSPRGCSQRAGPGTIRHGDAQRLGEGRHGCPRKSNARKRQSNCGCFQG